MSKSIRKGALKGSVAADRTVKITPYTKAMSDFTVIERTSDVEPGEADWADMNLAGLDVLARASNHKRRVNVWEDRDGNWWRTAGAIFLLPGRDGQLRFSITTRRGLTMSDVRYFEHVIEQAIQGRFLRYGWRSMTTDDGREGWAYSYSRPCRNPFTHSDWSSKVAPCTDNRCTARWHDIDDADHVADEFEGKGYSIAVSRFEAENDEYVVSVSAEADLTSSQLASFMSDLHWAAESARRVNASPIDSVVKGVRDSKTYWERRHSLEQSEQENAA